MVAARVSFSPADLQCGPVLVPEYETRWQLGWFGNQWRVLSDFMMPSGILNSRNEKAYLFKNPSPVVTFCIPFPGPHLLLPSQNTLLPLQVIVRVMSGETANKTNNVNFRRVLSSEGPAGAS